MTVTKDHSVKMFSVLEDGGMQRENGFAGLPHQQ